MRIRATVFAGGLLLAALVLVARESAQRSPEPAQRSPDRSAIPVPRPPAATQAAVSRDIFEFADEPAAATPSSSTGRATAEIVESAPAPLPTGPRLVGVLRRGGVLAAALAVDGDVVLLSPGQSAAGATVLSIEGEIVRVRLADGSETRLTAAE